VRIPNASVPTGFHEAVDSLLATLISAPPVGAVVNCRRPDGTLAKSKSSCERDLRPHESGVRCSVHNNDRSVGARKAGRDGSPVSAKVSAAP